MENDIELVHEDFAMGLVEDFEKFKEAIDHISGYRKETAEGAFYSADDIEWYLSR